VFLGESLLSWSAKKQPVVSRSSTEAEYRSLALVTAELFWLRMLFCELHIPLPTTPVIWCDNVSALALAFNPVYHARTKHIEVDYHFVREKVLNKDISLAFISTADQIADVFTKGLPAARFHFLKSKLKVTSSPVSLRGDVKLYDAAPSESATYAASHAEAFSKAATTSPTVNEVATMPAMSSEDSHQHIEDTVTNDTAISSSEITATKGKYHKHYDGNQLATKTTHQSWNVNARISCYAMYHQRKAVHNMEPILSTKH